MFVVSAAPACDRVGDPGALALQGNDALERDDAGLLGLGGGVAFGGGLGLRPAPELGDLAVDAGALDHQPGELHRLLLGGLALGDQLQPADLGEELVVGARQVLERALRLARSHSSARRARGATMCAWVSLEM